MHIDQLYKIYQEFPNISTDTRNVAQDAIFFALKGANFNGNAFADKALGAGARYAVIDDVSYMQNGEQYILVDDVLATLQELARYHRRQLDIPFIGVTGTNGKTTTKELINAVLSQKYRTYATKGNLNNHIGVPLTILSINDQIDIAIIEMGANHVGEIAFLCGIAQLEYGLITNVGKAHLEGFGSFEGVKKAKGELYDYLSEHDGTLFLQSDNPFLKDMLSHRPIGHVVRYGFSEGLDVSGRLVSADPYLSVEWSSKNSGLHKVKTHLTGSYNTENILASIAIGQYFGVDVDKINQGISGYVPHNNRSQITKTERNVVIADFYNANASSMAAALDNLEVIAGEKKALILGDMFEMGNESFEEHRQVIQKARSLDVDRRFFVGKAFYEQRDQQDHFFSSTEDAKNYLQSIALEGYIILLKGSRGMAFEKLMEVL